MDARSRTLARLRGLLALTAAASTGACATTKPRFEQPFQASDPVPPPVISADIQVYAQWAEGAKTARVEVVVLGYSGPLDIKVREVRSGVLVEQRPEGDRRILVFDVDTSGKDHDEGEPEGDVRMIVDVLVSVPGDVKEHRIFVHLNVTQRIVLDAWVDRP